MAVTYLALNLPDCTRGRLPNGHSLLRLSCEASGTVAAGLSSGAEKPGCCMGLCRLSKGVVVEGLAAPRSGLQACCCAELRWRGRLSQGLSCRFAAVSSSVTAGLAAEWGAGPEHAGRGRCDGGAGPPAGGPGSGPERVTGQPLHGPGGPAGGSPHGCAASLQVRGQDPLLGPCVLSVHIMMASQDHEASAWCQCLYVSGLNSFCTIIGIIFTL